MRRLLLLAVLPACIWTTQAPDEDGDGSPSGEDCDDQDPARHPGLKERCNLIDDDCDGLYDEEAIDAPRWYWDQDGDGLGDPSAPLDACWQPQGFVDNADDCDDRCAACGPGQEEVCDGQDNDCDGVVDEAGASGGVLVYEDADGDGFGDPSGGTTVCTLGEGVVEEATDCDDADDSVFPGARDTCGDGVDQDCDGLVTDCTLDLLSQGAAFISGDEFGDFFGSVVLGPGDLDGDGFTDLVASAPQSDSGFINAGSVYLYQGPFSGALGPEDADRQWTGRESYDQLGTSLSVLSDQNGDGVAELVFGAPTATRDRGGQGIVCVQRGIATWEEACRYAIAFIEGSETGAHAGAAVSGLGDLNGDGVDDLLVGAPLDDHAGTDAGAVHLFLGPLDGGLGTDDADHTWHGDEGSTAGSTLAHAGDLDGDGLDEVLVGGPGWKDGGGRAWLLGLDGAGNSALADAARATVDGLVEGDQLGSSLSSAGDLDGDGIPEVALGAWLVSEGDLANTGAVYLFTADQLEGSVSPADAWATVGSSRPQSTLGTAVAAVGDFDGSGASDLLVGGSVDPAVSAGAGLGALLLDPGGGWMDVDLAGPALVGSGTGDRTGSSVAGLGDTNGDGLDDVALGAPGAVDGRGAVSLVLGGATW